MCLPIPFKRYDSPTKWATWAWCDQTYVADNEAVFKGITSILEGKIRKKKAHKDLWCTIIGAIRRQRAEGRTMKTEKVSSHQTEEKKKNETKEEGKRRELNEGAGELAVQAGKEHQMNEETMKKYKEHKQIGKDVQKMILAILEARGEVLGEVYLEQEIKNQRSKVYEAKHQKIEEQIQKEMDARPEFKAEVEKSTRKSKQEPKEIKLQK